MRNLIFLSVFLLSGCGDLVDKYYSEGVNFETEQEAVIFFYKSNYKLIKSLNNEQELLGYALKCGDAYQYTNSTVGGLYNKVTFDVETKCDIVAMLHTHPLPPEGMTVDFFSEADLSLSKTLNVYLFTLEKHIIRIADGSQMKYGRKVGTINL